ncbi:nuclear transport factor 2 family protein [Bradyrhizobium sp.]|uniref:YybH family protein n=1 Tax=Bradyrhizobium sp. TaxID=376 RepID=UPI001DC57C4B|nr:nuclear transport factor 2 family protein [Bradyrhizobium sp.]MBI5323211.1 nuclear transport factor 2 family protein [Bradyrhizobium sp.]
MRAVYLIAIVLLTAFATPVPAQPVSGEAEVRAALKQWMTDFNAGRADKVCDIFAPTLRADVDGFPERTFDIQCKVLQTVLADPDHSLSYALDIKEILADGDMAAVRLLWTLTSKNKSSGETKVTEEQGLDIFGRSSDGRWQIIRFMSYER